MKSNDNNNTPGNKTEANKQIPKISIPTQKTFKFSGGKSAEKIDEEINAWLEKTTRDGMPAMLGKVSCNHATGEMYYIFMFTQTKDK